jgi:Zn-dependent peptidase ImmA (M78 family)
LPVEGGFEVYLRDHVQKDVDLANREETDEALSMRQRFSLAHEIAHTRFYKLSEAVPSPDGSIANGLELEEICNKIASYILVPTSLLKREIHLNGEQIDSDFVRLIASRFRISLRVALERLSLVEPVSSSERCILLARKHQGDAEIRALCFGVGLLPLIPRPRKYMSVAE